MEKTTVENIADWETVARGLLDTLPTNKKNAVVIALNGDLGAGKTTFVQALARVLGVIELVTSPTFTILKRYDTTHPDFTSLVHIDAYRLESETELGPLQFDDLLQDPNTLICIEWAEKIKNTLPTDTHILQLEIGNNNEHTIQSVS